MNKDELKKIIAARDEEDGALLPEGYEGEELFPASGESAENKEKKTDTGKGAEKENGGKGAAQGRDLRKELFELLKQKPELREKLANGEKLPREVISSCMKNGVPLRVAYAEYEAKQAKAEVEKMRSELAILKQNSASAAKAPVKGTAAGGAANTKGKDPFLEGLLSDE